MSSAFQPRPDAFRLQIWGARCETATDLFPFLDLLEAFGIVIEQFAPSVGRRAKFSRERLVKFFDESSAALSFSLLRETAPEIGLSFSIYRSNDDGRGIGMSGDLPAEMFNSVGKGNAFAAGLGPALAEVGIISGLCHSAADKALARVARTRDVGWEPESIEGVYWLNWYGRAFVDTIGRDRVLTTPAAMLVELSDGSILWTTSASPADSASDESRIAQAKARCHLVDGVSFDAELERLRSRSRSLVRVEPTWRPEIDDVMARIANNVGPLSQSEIVAEVNALPILPVDEYRPTAGVTTDVEDPADSIETYEMYAEQLIALLHDKVEPIGEFDPKDLPGLDAHFWHHTYPEQFPQRVDELVSAVGGYIGEMLVRRFGGRWVPREALDEAAVVIGDRAWLPFARARKYLVNRAGAVQASMTYFVREIERTLR